MTQRIHLQPGELQGVCTAISRYRHPSNAIALWQLANTLIPYALLWYLMYRLQDISLWLTVPVAIVAGALLVRVFIIFHDCGHGSFFSLRWANHLVGFATGVLTFTPYHQWHREHSIHHGTSGQLDRRGTGDIWTMTVREYQAASRWKRARYRLARQPVVLFAIAPLIIFVLAQRFPSPGTTRRALASVLWTNLALLCVVGTMCWLMGATQFLFIQIAVLLIAGAAGLWLFYVQHQFEGAYWARGESWNFADAALQGSSYYKLPRVLQWLTGNIGFHHVHHLCPGIPNYRLQACHEAIPAFRRIQPITLSASLRSLALHLWDESEGRLVGFGRAHVPVRGFSPRSPGRPESGSPTADVRHTGAAVPSGWQPGPPPDRS